MPGKKKIVKKRKSEGGGNGGGGGDGQGSTKKRRVGILRKRVDAPDEEIAPPVQTLDDSIKKRNKKARIIAFQKFKVERAMRKLARREKRKRLRDEHGEEAVPKLVPKTTDNMREADETMAQSDDEEIEGDEADDEYFEHYHDDVEPKLLLTTQVDPGIRTTRFMEELTAFFPNCHYFERRGYTVRQITQYAVNRGFSDVMIVGDSGGGQKSRPFSMIITHLPQGPTHWYRISNVLFNSEIKNAGVRTEHYPELLLRGFSTRLGKRVARQFTAMFPQLKDEKGRNVAVIHNHRDFMFIRNYRYMYESTEAVRLQETGPRFTLRLKSLQAGLFNPRFGEFEWFRKKKEMDKSRRRFHL
eukprot:TRINITY_DN42827_c0_g1_i1.p1 TRINITY_DN42827_c0_g1~~TRINITY_DN42827_c0_g1_i1.p1  ORF type:complete len:357 (+),score=151.55 TRINITY_DN42827_c0_g1_i1:131-1201(+)